MFVTTSLMVLFFTGSIVCAACMLVTGVPRRGEAAWAGFDRMGKFYIAAMVFLLLAVVTLAVDAFAYSWQHP
jgi:hypothetical protein